MAKVYVTQETNHDFRQAEEFGGLVFLSVDRRDDFHNLRNSEHNERLIAHLRHGLRDFDSERDYVVLVGSPYVQAAVMAIIGGKVARSTTGRAGYGNVNLLRWDNRDMIYIPLTINF